MTSRVGPARSLAGLAFAGIAHAGFAGAGFTGAGALAGCAPEALDTVVVTGAFAPTIVSVDRVACTAPAAGERWDIALTATDPQGADTVASGHVSVLEARGGELSRYDLACTAGACTGGSRADIDGVTCDLADIAFVFTVTDADGNVSAPHTHTP